jgi:hypothetical protein
MDGIESDLGAYCFLWGISRRDYRDAERNGIYESVEEYRASRWASRNFEVDSKELHQSWEAEAREAGATGFARGR